MNALGYPKSMVCRIAVKETGTDSYRPRREKHSGKVQKPFLTILAHLT